MISSKRSPDTLSPGARPASASTPNVRFGGAPSKLQPSPPSAPRIIFGARSRNAVGTRSNTVGGSLMWQSAEMTRVTGVPPTARSGWSSDGEITVGEPVQVDGVVPQDLAL